jgi:thioredoxin reductase (NADPH)
MIYDVLIIGGGPAGLTAGMYAARAGLKTMLLEAGMPGGQASTTDWIENYPGFPGGVSGIDLMSKFMEQGMNFGLEMNTTYVTGTNLNENIKIVQTEQGDFEGHAVIICSGATWRELGVEGEKRLRGAGVSYCATCDGAFYKNKEVVVVGGGDSALEEAIFLTKFASKVTIVHRRDQFRAAQIIQKRAEANEKISFKLNAVVFSIEGEKKVEKVILKNVDTGALEEYPTDGVFIFIGTLPNASLVHVEKDSHGYILTDEALVTSIEGVFAAGDVRKKALKQVSTAVGDGAIAAMSAEKYLAEHVALS